MSNEPTTIYAIIYEIDGAKLFGELCKTPECAVNSINPLDGSTVLGMATLDRVPGSALMYWKRNKEAAEPTPGPQAACCECGATIGLVAPPLCYDCARRVALHYLERDLASRRAPKPAAQDEADGYYLASFKRLGLGAPVLWWRPENAGYTADLQQAGVYTELTPNYHDSGHTVPVPTWFLRSRRIRHEIDPGDEENVMFGSAEKLRAAIAADLKAGG